MNFVWKKDEEGLNAVQRAYAYGAHVIWRETVDRCDDYRRALEDMHRETVRLELEYPTRGQVIFGHDYLRGMDRGFYSHGIFKMRHRIAELLEEV